jgi:gamma-glutamylcyclotransferase (GGCT)/AIG2-like uncharacterized protein YtfP
MTLHFSYGANMDRAAMAKRCTGAVALGAALLDGYRFTITADGYASIAPASGSRVHGVLWRLTPRALAALNIFESLDSGLYRRVVLPVRIGGKRRPALVYLGRSRPARAPGAGAPKGRPQPGYIEQVVRSARAWDLPDDYVRTLERWSPAAWRGKHPAETGQIA